MKRPYEKPDAELLAVEAANFFCTNQKAASSSGLQDLEGEEW
jgi:hypothetical protein